MDIQKKIKELRLLPLFPDSNFEYTYFNLSDFGRVIDINDLREDVNLRFTITLFYADKGFFEKYTILGRVYNYENGEDFLNISNSYTKVGIFEAINKFNEFYEELAKKFNELLLKDLKEELEKEKQKAKEKEDKQKKEKDNKDKGQDSEGEDSEGQDSEGQDSEGEDSEGQDGEGQDGEGEDSEGQGGEGQDGEGEDGEGEDGEGQDGEGQRSEGQGGELSSKDIQDLLDQINQENSSEGVEGQSDVNGIDFEDFLNKVNEGKIPNDFTKHYNNPELIREINSLNKAEEPEDDLRFLDSNYDESFEEKNYGSLGEVLKEQFKINNFELKRRFPNPDFIKDFVSILSKKEVDNLSEKIGIEENFSTLEKKNKLITNLITEIQNL
jgi:hypothetical protein